MKFKWLLILVIVLEVCLDQVDSGSKISKILDTESSNTSKDDGTPLMQESTIDTNNKGKGIMKNTSSTDPEKYPEPLIHITYQRNGHPTTPIKNNKNEGSLSKGVEKGIWCEKQTTKKPPIYLSRSTGSQKAKEQRLPSYQSQSMVGSGFRELKQQYGN